MQYLMKDICAIFNIVAFLLKEMEECAISWVVCSVVFTFNSYISTICTVPTLFPRHFPTASTVVFRFKKNENIMFIFTCQRPCSLNIKYLICEVQLVISTRRN